MKAILRILLVTLALFVIETASVSWGQTTKTVKSGGGGDYTTIQACATAMTDPLGNTCTVYAGTYNEHPTIPAGTAGNYKIVTVNGSDVVTVQGFTIASHDKIVGNCPILHGTVTSATCGFFLTNPSSPTTSCVSVSSSTTDSSVSNNTMYACGTISFSQSGSHNSNITFQGNSIAYPETTTSGNDTGAAFSVHCDGCLFDSNDLSHTSDGFTEIDGNNNVIRNNTFHDNLLSECTIGGHGDNCHIDFVASEPNVPGGGYVTNHNLIEGNADWNCNSSPGCHMYLQQADTCSGSCTDSIVRFNQGAHVYSAGLENDNKWAGMYNYNNTELDVGVSFGGGGGGGIADSCSNSATNCQYKNNIYYYLGSITDFNAIGVSGGTLTLATHNMAFCTTSCSGLHGTSYGSGTWTGSGQISANPLLVAPSTSGTTLGDNHLQGGSPALNGGANLTTVNGTVTSSTTLVVADAGFFQANSAGIAGVQPDCIAITTVSSHACITAINYSTNTLTLASPISATNGDSVWLYSDSSGNVQLTGSAPNIGALGTSTPTVATPTFSPVAGSYGPTQTVTISTSTSGAALCYTTDGSTPTANGAGACTHGTTYSTPVSISVTTTLKAVGSKASFADSSVASGTYTINGAAVTPTFSPVAGSYGPAQSVTISSTTTGVTLCYTTDGSTPTANGAGVCTHGITYSSPVSVASSLTLKAVASKSGWIDSSVGSAAYTINGTVATPTFSPVGGTYTSAQSVSLSTVTGGAVICYTTDGSTPTASSGSCTHGTAYVGPITVATTSTIKALGTESAFVNSAVASATYTISMPTFTLTVSTTGNGTGTVNNISNCATGTNTLPSGSTITCGQTASAGTFTGWSGSCTGTGSCSFILSGNSTVTATFLLAAATPTFSPVAGSYTSVQTVTISDATGSSTICFTQDGSTPTANGAGACTHGTTYSSPITVSSTQTVKAIASKAGFSDSAVGSAAYTITLPVATPTFLVAAGSYSTPQRVVISSSTPSSTCFYTVDGSSPTTGSTPYTFPLRIAQSQTLKSICSASGFSNSAIGTAAYTIAHQNMRISLSPSNSSTVPTYNPDDRIIGGGGPNVNVIWPSCTTFNWTAYDAWVANAASHGWTVTYTYSARPTCMTGASNGDAASSDIDTPTACGTVGGVALGTIKDCKWVKFVMNHIMHVLGTTTFPLTPQNCSHFDYSEDGNEVNTDSSSGSPYVGWTDTIAHIAQTRADSAYWIRKGCSNTVVSTWSVSAIRGFHANGDTNQYDLYMEQALTDALADGFVPDVESIHMYPARQSVMAPMPTTNQNTAGTCDSTKCYIPVYQEATQIQGSTVNGSAGLVATLQSTPVISTESGFGEIGQLCTLTNGTELCKAYLAEHAMVTAAQNVPLVMYYLGYDPTGTKCVTTTDWGDYDPTSTCPWATTTPQVVTWLNACPITGAFTSTPVSGGDLWTRTESCGQYAFFNGDYPATTTQATSYTVQQTLAGVTSPTSGSITVDQRPVFLTSSTVVSAPTFSPSPGAYSSVQSVTLSSSTSGAAICYTTDGTNPAASTPGACSAGSTYSGAISVPVTTTIKALGTKSGDVNSTISSGTYTITLPTAPTNVQGHVVASGNVQLN